jgi:putative peptidoglycan lipid II flippase
LLLLAAPAAAAAAALAIIAVPLIATLFHHGAFTAADVFKTRDALQAYGIGLLGLILIKVLAPGFYARQNVRTPVRIGILTLCVTQALNCALVGWLDHAGLALSISLAACLNAALLYHGLRRQGIYAPLPGWRTFFIKLALALAAMGAALHLAGGDPDAWLEWRFAARLARLSLVVCGGAGVYFAVLWILGFRLRDFRRRAAD